MKSLLVHAALHPGGPMTAEGSPKDSIAGTSLAGSRVPPHQAMVAIAERELELALLEQSQPAIGMYAHPSSEEHAVVQRAVRRICFEAHGLDLKAEELLVGIKEAWSHLAHVRARHLGDRDGDVLREVVSGAIEVFFEARAASADGRRE